MRIQSLKLRYGMFADRELDFGVPADDPDLTILVGANETGKTTLADAVADLFFGFPRFTRHGYEHDPALLRVGAVLDAGGETLELVRRKGASKTLLGPDGTPIDEAALRALLHGHDRESYMRALALNQQRLRDGGRSILSGADHAGRTILAAGTGLDSLARVARTIAEEADAIWSAKRANRRTFYAAQDSLDESKVRLKQAIRRPSDWEAAVKRRDSIGADLDRLRVERAACAREREDVERTRRVMVPLARLDLVRRDLDALAAVPTMPADAAEILRQTSDDILVAEAAIKEADETIADASAEASSITVNEALLGRDREIQALIAASGAVERSLRQLPSCRSRMAEASLGLAERMEELGSRTEPGGDTPNRLPDRGLMAELRQHLDQHDPLASRAEDAGQAAAARDQEFELLEREFAGLPAAIDRAPVEACLREARHDGDLGTKAERARLAADDAIEQLDHAMAALLPWSGTAEALRATALISEEHAAKHSVYSDEAARTVREVEQTRRRSADELQGLAVEIEQLSNARAAVPESELLAARRSRDDLWRKIRSGLAGKRRVPEPEVVSAEYEAKVQAADVVADRRYLSAEDSARLLELERRSERLCLQLDQLGQELSIAAGRQLEINREWHRLLEERGLPILAPEQYRDWQRLAGSALTAADRADHLASDADALEIRAAGLVSKLISALRLAGLGEAELEEWYAQFQDVRLLRLVVDAAERIVSEEIDCERIRSTLVARIDDARKAREAARKVRGKAEADLSQWRHEFERLLRRAGMIPATSPARAKYLVETVAAARTLIEELAALERRIAGVQEEEARFEERVATVAASCGVSGWSDGTPALVARLADDVASAARAADRRRALLDRIDADEGKRKQARVAIARAEMRLEPLVQSAGTADRTEIAQLIQQSVTRAAKEKLEEQLVAEILEHGEGRSLDQLADACRGQDPAELADRSAALQLRAETLSGEIERLAAERVVADADLAGFDASLDAAAAAADVEQALAALDEEASAYVKARIQTCVLRYAVAKYRAQQEAPLLRRASQLYSRVTLGRYSGLAVDREDEEPRLVALMADGSTVVPASSLSDGAADQIYSALRIAAIEATIDAGVALPILFDDVFAAFDDARAAACFGVIAELATRTQVLYLTHHSHHVAIAERTLGPGVRVVELG